MTGFTNVVPSKIRRPGLYQSLRTAVREGLHLSSDILKCSRLALTGKLIRMPMKSITDEFAFSLVPDGWNFYCDLIAEYEKSPDISLETTKFFRFFQDERVKRVRYLNDLLFLHIPGKRSQEDEFKFYLGTYPWGGLTRADSLAGGTPFGWHFDRVEGKKSRDLWGYGRNLWYEPGDRYTLEVEKNVTIRIYRSLKKRYLPLLYLPFPVVTLLVRRDGERRALILDGHHRLSALSYLGYEQVIVELTDTVNENEVEQWYYVKNGLCTRQLAVEIFSAFFELNGRERIAYLDL